MRGSTSHWGEVESVLNQHLGTLRLYIIILLADSGPSGLATLLESRFRRQHPRVERGKATFYTWYLTHLFRKITTRVANSLEFPHFKIGSSARRFMLVVP
jgi:hypothetical protein